MRGRRLIVLLLVFTVTLSLGLVLLRLLPRLAAVSPADGSAGIAGHTTLRISFSRPMQPETLPDLLTTDPPRQGKYDWQGNTLVFTPDHPWPSGSTVTVQLASGARSRLGLPMLQGKKWTFEIGRPRLAYLWPATGPADIYALESSLGEIQRLTNTPYGVLDYSVSPDGMSIFFSAINAVGGSDLFLLDRLADSTSMLRDCQAEICRTPQLAAHTSTLAFQHTALSGGGDPSASVRLLDLADGTPGAETQVARIPALSSTLRWSATGLLAYYDSSARAFMIHDPHSGSRTRFPNQTGVPGNWSPDGRTYVAPEIMPVPASENPLGEVLNTSHLLRFNYFNNQIEDLTQQPILEDTNPTFSPDGVWLAFARKYLDPTRWTPGRQLWVMLPDGSQAHPLTDDPVYTHTDFAWSPDSSQLAFRRFNQTTLTDPPELWLINADGSEPIRLIIGGYDPQWIP